MDLDTPHGPARAHLHLIAAPRAALVLGHGAGGSVTARDLVAVTAAACRAGLSVALIEQPYRVAGRRSPAPARQLDAVWVAAVEQLRAGPLGALPLVAGGRSSGARVACRTARATAAAAVLCLAFPLRPPARAAGAAPQSRRAELDGVEVAALVVQGAADHFGRPPAGPTRRVVIVPGDHRLIADLAAVADAVGDWLGQVVVPSTAG